MRMASPTIHSSSRGAVLALAAVLLHCMPAASAPPPAKASMSKYDEAVRLLASPKTWCEGARQLAQLKDARAIVPLLAAYDRPIEAPTLCLADAMEELGATTQAATLVASKQLDDRVAGVRLMVVFTSDDHLAPLREVALHDPDIQMRDRALEALHRQRQTAAWEDVIGGFLASDDERLRGWALDRLIEHNGTATWARVEAHAAKEKSPVLRAKIEAALKARPAPP